MHKLLSEITDGEGASSCLPHICWQVLCRTYEWGWQTSWKRTHENAAQRPALCEFDNVYLVRAYILSAGSYCRTNLVLKALTCLSIIAPTSQQFTILLASLFTIQRSKCLCNVLMILWTPSTGKKTSSPIKVIIVSYKHCK